MSDENLQQNIVSSLEANLLEEAQNFIREIEKLKKIKE